ncbi:MAG: hypothetical protein WBX15_16240 [Thermoanaerobaculia bacterium]
MAELIQQYKEQIASRGTEYVIRVYGEQRTDDSWDGWVEFHPLDDVNEVLRTGRETWQPDRGALAYWASGLEALYFDGAIQRARPQEEEPSRDRRRQDDEPRAEAR